MLLESFRIQRLRKDIGVLFPGIYIPDPNSPPNYGVTNDVELDIFVSRPPTTKSIGRHLDCSFIILVDLDVDVDRGRHELLHLTEETELVHRFRQCHIRRL